jgi:CTP synthase
MKFIIVSGGVLSGLGKGVTAASIGLLLKSSGYKVTIMKCDMYLNIDAGTMNPIEHGEVFVTHDGLETDQDLGHYERFLNETLLRENYLTSGQVYKLVLDKERALFYDGACVQPYHHIPPEIIKRWFEAGKKHQAEIVIIELGGTVGEYEGLLFFEAARRLKLKYPKDVCFVHVGYLPAPPSIGELKSKPIQQSISQLHSLGIQPDFVICRAEREVDLKRREKISLSSGVPLENIISNPDVKNIYEVPLWLEKQKLDKKIIRALGLKRKIVHSRNLENWKKIVSKSKKAKNIVNIGIVGKYQKTGDYLLSDSYVCVVESLKHAAFSLGLQSEINWIDSSSLEKMSDKQIEKIFSTLDGLIVPQGWGSRGVEGKIKAAKFARENNIPYLGLCFGMQMAVIEFARNVLGFKDANSQEVNPETSHPVIHIMPNQKKYLAEKQYGGTIRLGAWPCLIAGNMKLEEAYLKYGKDKKSPWFIPNPLQKQIETKGRELLIFERHRHRYEFNLSYRKQFEKAGLVVSGISPDGKLVEAIEIKNHPFFVGVQFHPEYLSRPLFPHPIFVSFLEAVKNNSLR